MPSATTGPSAGTARSSGSLLAFLELEKLAKSFGTHRAVDGLTLDVEKGEFVSLLGPSGCGKTTTLQMIAGFVEPSGGAIRLEGRDLLAMKPAQRGLGIVFQSYALFPHMTAAENVSFGLEMQRVAAPERVRRVGETLELVGLGAFAGRYPRQLSGGQQQRVAVARALVIRPQILLLDEPLSNLDAKLREEARAFLRELIVRLGLSALMVTHDQSEAMAMSDRILLLNNGVIEQQGTPEEMYGAPQTLFTAEFMGSNNRVNGKIAEVRDGMARLVDEAGGWSLWGVARGDLKPGASAHGVIRLEQVRVGVDNADNTIRLPLATRMYLGDRWECLFRATGDAGTGLRAYASSAPSEGQYALTFPREQFWLYAA